MRNTSKKIICFLLTFMLVMASIMPAAAAESTKLSDIVGISHGNILEKWVEKGYIKGYPDNTFRPYNTITRAEFMALVNRAFSFTETADINFTDVNQTDWFYTEAAKAVKAAYMAGDNEGKLNPTSNINREELAVVLARLAKLDMTVNNDLLNKLLDAELIPEWSKGAISAVLSKNLFEGFIYDFFKPAENVTRLEVVVVLDRLLVDMGLMAVETTPTPTSTPEILPPSNDNSSSNTTTTNKSKNVAVASVSLNKTELTLAINRDIPQETLIATINPTNATNKNLIWSSDNEDVVTVDSTGKLTTKGTGKAVITVKTSDGNKTATCDVTVAAYAADEEELLSLLEDESITIIFLEDGTFSDFSKHEVSLTGLLGISIAAEEPDNVLVIDREGVTIAALNEHKAIIDGKIKITASDVTISGLAVNFAVTDDNPNDETPIVWACADNAKLLNLDVDFTYDTDSKIGINDNTYIVAIDSGFEGAEIKNCSIQKNFPDNWLEDSNWRSRAGQASIIAEGDNDNVVISGNSVYGGPIAAKNGIANIEISNNNIDTTADEGIWIVDASNIALRNNSIKNQGIRDAEVDGSELKIVNRPESINGVHDDLLFEDNLLSSNPGAEPSGIQTVYLPWIVYVDDDYTESTFNFGNDRFSDIQSAIEEGRTVVVLNGEYSGFDVDKNNVTVAEQYENEAIVNGTVIISADYATIKRLTVKAEGAGIDITQNASSGEMSNHATIDNNVINALTADKIGITLHAGYYSWDDNYYNTYTNNTINDFRTGIFGIMEGDTVTGNKIINAYAGLGGVGGAANIKSNTFELIEGAQPEIQVSEGVYEDENAEGIGTHYSGNEPAVRTFIDELLANNTFIGYELGLVFGPEYSGHAKVAYYGEQGLCVPETVYVDDDWSDWELYPYGTEVTVGSDTYYIGVDAFAYVSDAVNAVQWFESIGETVKVLPGTYYEYSPVYVDKAISILGPQSDPARVSGRAGEEAAINFCTYDNWIYDRIMPGFVVMAPDVEIKGFTIKNVNIYNDYEKYPAISTTAVEEPNLDKVLKSDLTKIIDDMEKSCSNSNTSLAPETMTQNYEANRIGIVLYGANGCNIENNDIQGMLAGIIAISPYYAIDTQEVEEPCNEEQSNSIIGNYLHGNRFGFGQGPNDCITELNNNSIDNNMIGVLNLSGNWLDARYNWWGTTEVIEIAAEIIDLSSVLSNGQECLVDYFPWAMDEGFTSYANEGATDIRVDGNWTDKNIGEKITIDDKDYYFGFNAYSSIQRAIDSVHEEYYDIEKLDTDQADAAIINVAPGEYYESIYIDKSNIVLNGPQADVVPVEGQTRGDEAVIYPYDYYGFRVMGYNTVINGFTIKYSYEGIEICDEYYDFGANCVKKKSETKIINNIFNDNCYGVYAYEYYAPLLVENNVLKQNMYEDEALSLIKVDSSSIKSDHDPMTRISKLKDSTHKASDEQFAAQSFYTWGYGIYMDGIGNFSILNNTISGMGEANCIDNYNDYTKQSIQGNNLHGNYLALELWEHVVFDNKPKHPEAGIKINYNSFESNNYNMYKCDCEDVMVDATNNWWGSEKEIDILTLLDGDKDNINYFPWSMDADFSEFATDEDRVTAEELPAAIDALNTEEPAPEEAVETPVVEEPAPEEGIETPIVEDPAPVDDLEAPIVKNPITIEKI